MSEAPEAPEAPAPPPSAWQPFTFGGVAAFARAGWLRLLGVEFVAALLISASAVALVRHVYAPVVLEAIQKMPPTARITQGRLAGIDTTLISETKFLALAVTPDVSNQIGQSADIQVQLRPEDYRVGSIFRPDWGWESDYGTQYTFDLSGSHLEPWWGAWHPIVFAMAGVVVVVLMFILWAVVGAIYTVPAQFLAWVADRKLSWNGAWRLGVATLLPGGLLMALGVILYGWEAMDLVALVFLWAAHLLISWVYLVGGVLACPRLFPKVVQQNPFVS